MLQLSQQIIQLPVLLQPSTLTYSPSMKIAESGSDLLIFSWPSLSPASMWCEITTGLNFFFLAPAYSLWRKGGKKSGAKREPWDIHTIYTFITDTNTVHIHNIYTTATTTTTTTTTTIYTHILPIYLASMLTLRWSMPSWQISA